MKERKIEYPATLFRASNYVAMSDLPQEIREAASMLLLRIAMIPFLGVPKLR